MSSATIGWYSNKSRSRRGPQVVAFATRHEVGRIAFDDDGLDQRSRLGADSGRSRGAAFAPGPTRLTPAMLAALRTESQDLS